MPIHPDTRWPIPILTTVVTSFSGPAAHIVLLVAHLTPGSREPAAASVTPASPAPVTAPPPESRPGNDEVQVAHTTIIGLRRVPRVLHLHPAPGPAHPSTAHRHREDPLGTLAGVPRRPALADQLTTPDDAPPPRADLVITSVSPEHASPDHADRLAQVAARLLRTGGVLAVLTHSHHTAGRLADPTGTLVTAAQNADLLYLQHIVALHTPLHDGRFDTTGLTTNDETTPAAHHPQPPPEHAAPPPSRHTRIHRDLLIFSQPHHQHPGPPAPALPAPTHP